MAGLFIGLGLIFWIATRIEPVELSRLEKHERRMQLRRWFDSFLWFLTFQAVGQASALLLRDYFQVTDAGIENLRFAAVLLYAGLYMVKQLMDLREPLNLISLRETPAEAAARILAKLKPIQINFQAAGGDATEALNRLSQSLNDICKRKGGQ